MVTNVIRAVLIGSIALVSASCGRSADAAPNASKSMTAPTATGFQPFWAAFRKAALANDMVAVAGMTSFPLKAKGELDDAPVKTITRAAFPLLFAAILKEDANVRGFQGTTLDFIRANPAFPAGKLDGGGHQQLGDLVFGQGSGGWNLAMVYQPDAE